MRKRYKHLLSAFFSCNCSVFEAWYIKEHRDTLDLPEEWIADTFATTTFYNGLSAIVAGLVANILTESLGYGPTAPFMLAIGCFLICLLVVTLSWDENYGNQSSNLTTAYKEGFVYIMTNRTVLLLGAMQSIVEACMYIFVFLWTPVLTQQDTHTPLGMVFAAFMICIMIGSSIFSLLIKGKE